MCPGRTQYYLDTCLLFGLRSAPFSFNKYATAIKWIMTHNYQLHHLIHYLGVPVAMEKVEGPLTAMSFLGLILDSVKQATTKTSRVYAQARQMEHKMQSHKA